MSADHIEHKPLGKSEAENQRLASLLKGEPDNIIQAALEIDKAKSPEELRAVEDKIAGGKLGKEAVDFFELHSVLKDKSDQIQADPELQNSILADLAIIEQGQAKGWIKGTDRNNSDMAPLALAHSSFDIGGLKKEGVDTAALDQIQNELSKALDAKTTK